ncbi:MAG: stage III sporulation protein AB [Cellulosilyticum sp.]|nr:stage III sporulation protein AB [Cellulosilyticum sp.]
MKGIILAVIFVICSLMGIWVDEDQRKRIKQLESFEYLFGLLRGEIDYQLTPLKEACKQISQRDQKGIGQIFDQFAKELEAKESADLNEMWKSALETYKGKLHLKETDYEILESFSNACGYLDKNMQKRNLDFVIEKLAHEKKLSAEKYERCSKLNKSLGVLLGAAIVIFLL